MVSQLLDFDDDPIEGESAGLGGGGGQSADLFAAPSVTNSSSNPLDDLLSLGSWGSEPAAPSGVPVGGLAGLDLNGGTPSTVGPAGAGGSTGQGGGFDDLLF